MGTGRGLAVFANATFTLKESQARVDNVEDKYQVAHHHPVHSGDSGRPRHIARSSIACLTNTTMDGIALLKATQDDRHFERDTWLDSRGDGMFSVNDGGTTRLAVGES